MDLATGRYAGTGDGIESGPFDATIDVTGLPGGALAIDYVAISPTGGELHREHTVWSSTPDGRGLLVIAHSESPIVTTMVEGAPGVFSQPEPVGPYALSIHVEQPSPGRLRWAWWWAPTGEEPIERSCADVRLGPA